MKRLLRLAGCFSEGRLIKNQFPQPAGAAVREGFTHHGDPLPVICSQIH
jgi:hypothetical protein